MTTRRRRVAVRGHPQHRARRPRAQHPSRPRRRRREDRDGVARRRDRLQRSRRVGVAQPPLLPVTVGVSSAPPGVHGNTPSGEIAGEMSRTPRLPGSRCHRSGSATSAPGWSSRPATPRSAMTRRRARPLPRRVGGSHQRDRSLRAGVADLRHRRRRGRPRAGRPVGDRFTRRRSTSAGSATAARRSSRIRTAGSALCSGASTVGASRSSADWEDEQHVGAFAAALAGAERFAVVDGQRGRRHPRRRRGHRA